MTDILSLLALIGCCAVLVGYLSGDWLQWVRTEWRLMKSYRWTMDESPNTFSDERVQQTILRLADAKRRMRKERIPLLLEGRPTWQRMNDMSKGQSPAKVIKFRNGRPG